MKLNENNMENKMESVWEFVAEYYPNYYSSDDIALADDLHKIIHDEIDPGSAAERMWREDYECSMMEVIKDYNALHKEIYEASIEGYISKLNEQKNG